MTEKVRVESRDEIGAMAGSYNEMQKHLSNLVSQIKENAQKLSQGSDQLNTAAIQSSDSSHQVAQASQQMANGAQ